MSRSATTPTRGNRTLLALWAFIAALGLSTAALLCSVSVDVASSATFGSPGTQVVLSAAFVITMAGIVVGWRVGRPASVRQLAVSLLTVAAGATTVVAAGFFAGGEYAVLGILLVQSAIFIVVIAARVYRSSEDRAAPSVGAS